MQILFKTRHPEAALMRDAVERRVRFAFRRLNALVPRAEIKLEDINHAFDNLRQGDAVRSVIEFA